MIIIIRTNEPIDSTLLVTYFNKINTIEMCLVCNDSEDDMSDFIQDVKDYCKHVSIVNLKRYKSEEAAIKAGARYLNNYSQVDHLGYISESKLEKRDAKLIDVVKYVAEHQEQIVQSITAQKRKRKEKKTLFQRLFSISDFLGRTDNNDQNLHLNFRT